MYSSVFVFICFRFIIYSLQNSSTLVSFIICSLLASDAARIQEKMKSLEEKLQTQANILENIFGVLSNIQNTWCSITDNSPKTFSCFFCIDQSACFGPTHATHVIEKSNEWILWTYDFRVYLMTVMNGFIVIIIWNLCEKIDFTVCWTVYMYIMNWSKARHV